MTKAEKENKSHLTELCRSTFLLLYRYAQSVDLSPVDI